MTDAETLTLVAESWLRQQRRDGHAVPTDDQRAALQHAFTGLALEAPRTAARCPALMALIGPAAREAVLDASTQPQVTQADASPTTAEAGGNTSWITAAQAADLLGVKPDSVRWLLRRGQLTGRRHETGWRVDRQSVQRYGRRRGRTT